MVQIEGVDSTGQQCPVHHHGVTTELASCPVVVEWLDHWTKPQAQVVAEIEFLRAFSPCLMPALSQPKADP